MFKKFIITLSVLFSVLFINAQNKISGYIIDSLTNEPIEHVKITNLATKEVSYSGFNGLFKISDKKGGFSVLKFSHDAYNEKIVKIPSGVKKTEIFISQKQKNVQNFVKSANKINSFKNYQAYNLSIINKTDFINTNYTNFDDFLKYSSIYEFKPFGIYSNNPIISISGINSLFSAPSVFLDGFLLNNNFDYSLNSNIFPAGFVENIEISKTQLPALSSDNNYFGTLNIIPNLTNKEGFGGFGKFNFGNLNTYNLEISPEYKHFGEKGISFKLDAFAQKSDGYIQTPDSLKFQNIKYSKNNFEEAKINLILAYDFNRNHKIELITNYFQDYRFSGIKINDSLGNSTKTRNILSLLKYSGSFKNTNIGLNLGIKNDYKFGNIETIINNKYSLIQSNTIKINTSANLFINQKIADFYYLSAGINFNNVNFSIVDDYISSLDNINYEAKSKQYNAYFQNSFNFFKNNKLNFLIGVYAAKIISSALISDINQTSTSNLISPVDIDSLMWTKYNFNINSAIKFNIDKNLNIFASFNHGITNSSLEANIYSAFFDFGYKIGNINLRPQENVNLNGGLNFQNKNFTFNTELNYGLIKDYLMLIETGQKYFNGNSKVYQMQNISYVQIFNTNLNLKYDLANFEFFANYCYNKSLILQSDSFLNLKGKMLIFTPKHLIHGGIQFHKNNVKASLIANYFSKQYTNDNNSEFISSIFTFDSNVSVDILSNLNLNFSIQNILNYQYIYYNQSSIGRFMEIGIKYSF